LISLTVLIAIGWATQHWRSNEIKPTRGITAVATRTVLEVAVTAGGELESSKTVTVVSEVQGQQIKIVELIRDGSAVKAGDVVMRFDPNEIERALSAQEIKVKQTEALAKAAREELKIQQNKGDTEVAKAKLAHTLAVLDKKKYLEGDYNVEVNTLKGSIALAEADLNEAEDTADYYRKLVKKGFRTPEQLRTKDQAVHKAKYNLSRDQEKLRVLEEYMRERQEVELAAKADDAERELQRAQSSRNAVVTKAETDLDASEETTRLESSALAKLEKQLEWCTVRAPQDGIVVYQKDKGARIDLGSTVFFKQKLFSLPDFARMRVKAYIHESMIKKIRPGLNAEVRVDADPTSILPAVVTDVSNFFDSTRQWLSGGAKEYATYVEVLKQADSGLKPGMTAQVKILIDSVADALVVPVQAVTETAGQHYCYLVGTETSQWRRVTVGEANDYYVEIREGLTAGDRVALDARVRAAAEARAGDSEPARSDGSEPTRTAAAQSESPES
jgi:RND family efflux transporter MFP subunit